MTRKHKKKKKQASAYESEHSTFPLLAKAARSGAPGGMDSPLTVSILLPGEEASSASLRAGWFILSTVHLIVVAERENRHQRRAFLFRSSSIPILLYDSFIPQWPMVLLQPCDKCAPQFDSVSETGAPRPAPGRRRRPCVPMPAPRPGQRLPVSKNRRCAPWSRGMARR